MQKLVPYWGCSPQPGSTYYCQKLFHDIYGIVDHPDQTCMIYIFDETAGPKNVDHSVSYLIHYIENSGRILVWTNRIHLYLDNAGSTNKNAYFMAWAMEYVEQKKVDYLRISFLIPGHTKFDVDRVFSVISKGYATANVFTTAELAAVMSQSPDITTVIDNGNLVYPWRDRLSVKYTKLPGIRDLHDFILVRNPITNHSMMSVRKLCYSGAP